MADENAPADLDQVETEAVEEETGDLEAGEQNNPPTDEESPAGPKPKEEKAKDEPAPPSKRRWKIAGKEVELDDEETQERLNRAEYFDRSRKEVESARTVMRLFAEDPIGSAIQLFEGKLGSKEQAVAEVRKIVEGWLGDDLAYEHASPEEKKRIDLERENARLKAEREAREAQEKSARETAEWNTFTDHVEKALAAEGVDLDDEAIDDLVSVWNRAIDLEEKIDVAEVARRVRAQRARREARNLDRIMKDPAKLAERAPALKEQVRKEDIEQLKATHRSKRQTGPSANRAPRETPRQRPRAISMAEMDQELSRYS